VKTKLESAHTDVEVCKLLAENGFGAYDTVEEDGKIHDEYRHLITW